MILSILSSLSLIMKVKFENYTYIKIMNILISLKIFFVFITEFSSLVIAYAYFNELKCLLSNKNVLHKENSRRSKNLKTITTIILKLISFEILFSDSKKRKGPELLSLLGSITSLNHH